MEHLFDHENFVQSRYRIKKKNRNGNFPTKDIYTVLDTEYFPICHTYFLTDIYTVST